MLGMVVGCAMLSSPGWAERPFGPWDAGEKRAVDRQGKKGLDRRAHPAVGDPAKVPGEGPPAPSLRPDPDVPEGALLRANVVSTRLSSNPLYLAALTYRHFLTKMDGPRCQHFPTCSRFANQAVARHGIIGILMGLDRVIQPPQSSAIRSLPQVEGWGQVRFFDPVSNYEFWNEENFSGFPPRVDEKPLALVAPETSSPDENARGEGTQDGPAERLAGEEARR